MNKVFAKNKKEIEKFREKIFRAKEECRKEFANQPYEKKLKTAFELYKRFQYLKRFKRVEIQNDKTLKP